MGQAQILNQNRGNFIKFAAGVAAIFLAAAVCSAQTPPATPSPVLPWTQELNKYPGLTAEFGQLLEKLQHTLKFPDERRESHLLPAFPESTMAYAAFSNYGDVLHDSLTVFHQELKDSAVLRDWWEHGQLATSGPKLVDSLEKLAQLQQFLGNEIVFAGAIQGGHPKPLIIAEIKKPGLKPLLQQWITQVADKSAPPVRVLDLKELATALDKKSGDELILLVRPDFIVGATDIETLRGFSARLDQGNRDFVATPFGKRVAQEYAGGVTMLAAADLQKILGLIPISDKSTQATLQRSGFGDMKYLVWDHTAVAGQAVSQSELSFTAPRHGVASWLASPAPLGSLDFVDPKAMLSSTILLKNFAQIFDDVKELAGPANANSFASLAAGEQALKLSLKDDLLNHLTGEITIELDSVAVQKPLWKAMLKVDDANHVQQTLSALLAVAHFEVAHFDDGSVTYYTVRVPSGKTSTDIVYAFADGYLILGPSRGAVAKAVRLHFAGGSLAKSQRLLAVLPPEQPLSASAFLFEDPAAMATLQLRQFAPAMADSVSQSSPVVPPVTVRVYGEKTAIRSASTSSGMDVGVVLAVAAIAIPNLLRSKIAANEASAIGSVRTVNTAQVTYAAAYGKGFAQDLATLGPNPNGSIAESVAHANLVDGTLGNASCTGDAWCTKSGYQFRVTAVCKLHLCKEFVAVATPVDSNTGTRSFCSTSDGVIRFKTGSPLTAPVSISQCRAWTPLQ
jgi:hypothetical protein